MIPILVLFVLTTQVGQPPPDPQVSPAITAATYENFMKVEPRHRAHLFNRLTQWNQATLLREQLQRWRQQNADRFSQEQLSAVAEYLVVLDQLVAGSRASSERRLALNGRLEKLFTAAELEQASVLTGTYIP